MLVIGLIFGFVGDRVSGLLFASEENKHAEIQHFEAPMAKHETDKKVIAKHESEKHVSAKQASKKHLSAKPIEKKLAHAKAKKSVKMANAKKITKHKKTKLAKTKHKKSVKVAAK